jgi:hypothetical protein
MLSSDVCAGSPSPSLNPSPAPLARGEGGMSCERRDPLCFAADFLQSAYAEASADALARARAGERGARSALGLVCGVRWLSPINAARFARPVAIVIRRAWVSAVCAGEPQVPDGVRASHGPGPRRLCGSTTSTRRLTHARSRPSRPLGSASQ